MELSFVIDAVRRYWWIVVVATLLGGAAGFLVQTGGTSKYQSTGVLLLVPPSEDPVNIAGDTERYVANQLAVLHSSDLAEAVADGLSEGDEGFTAYEVSQAISFFHIDETDIVQVIAEHEDPDRAKAIVDAYLDKYILTVREFVAEETGAEGDPEAEDETEQERLTALLTLRRDELAQISDEIRDEMRAAIESAGPGGTPPEPESVVPGLVFDADLIQSQVLQISQQLTDLELQARLQVASRAIQQGDLPTAPLTSTSKILVAAGLVGGGLMGLFGAVLLARLSPRLLGPRHAEEILGQPLVGTLPTDPVLIGGPVAALGLLPHEVLEFVESVCVRAEASSQSGGGSLMVAVIGSERGAGTTTLAAAMANRFAAHGSDVLLVDADHRDRGLSRQLAPGKPGIAELLALAPTLPNLRDKGDPDLKQCLRPTAIPNLRVLGAGDTEETSVLRRQNVATVVAITSRTADVVVFDAGALMEASATVQLAHLADTVVLAIPDRQQAAALETVNRQLRGRRGTLLAVWSAAARRERGTAAAPPPAGGQPIDPEPPDPFDEAERQGLHARGPGGPAVQREISE